MTPKQRAAAHAIAVAPAGAALVVGEAGPPDGTPADASIITVDEALELGRAGWANVRRHPSGSYLAELTQAGVDALATVEQEDDDAEV